MRAKRLGVRLVRAVREVQPEHVDAGGNQRVEHFAAARWQDRRWR